MTDRSVVYPLTESFQIALAPNETELHVFTLPEICQVSGVWTQTPTAVPGNDVDQPSWGGAVNYTLRQAEVRGLDGQSVKYGLVNWATGTANSSSIPIPASDGGATYPSTVVLSGQTSGSTNYSRYCRSRVRIVGLGIEVTNTSPEINLSGSVTSYRLDYERVDTQRPWSSANTGTGFHATQTTTSATYRCPPRTSTEATLPPDSVTWLAKDGVYLTVPIYEDDGTFCEWSPRTLKLSDHATGGDNCLTLVPYANGLAANSPLTLTTSTPCMRRANVACSGAYFTGLTPGNTFLIKVRTYLEVFPATTDELFPLSTRSPAHDVQLLEAVACTYKKLPVAVPVHYNFSTKWWGMVISALGQGMQLTAGLAGPYSGAASAGGAFLVAAGKKMSNGVALTPPKPNGNVDTSGATANQAATEKNAGGRPGPSVANKQAHDAARAWADKHYNDRRIHIQMFGGDTLIYTVTAGMGSKTMTSKPRNKK